jgi:hypothetical protein
MTAWLVGVVLLIAVAALVVVRSRLLYRWPVFLRWRMAKSRRDRGKGSPGQTGMGEGTTDFTAGL